MHAFRPSLNSKSNNAIQICIYTPALYSGIDKIYKYFLGAFARRLLYTTYAAASKICTATMMPMKLPILGDEADTTVNLVVSLMCMEFGDCYLQGQAANRVGLTFAHGLG